MVSDQRRLLELCKCSNSMRTKVCALRGVQSRIQGSALPMLTWSAGPPEPPTGDGAGGGLVLVTVLSGQLSQLRAMSAFPMGGSSALWPLRQPGCCEWCQSYHIISSSTVSPCVSAQIPTMKVPAAAFWWLPLGFLPCLRLTLQSSSGSKSSFQDGRPDLPRLDV